MTQRTQALPPRPHVPRNNVRVDPDPTGVGARAESIRSWGAIAWSALGIVLIAVLAGWLLWRVRVVAVPVFVASIIAVALAPVVSWLQRLHVGRGIATVLTLLGLIGVFVAAGFLVAPTIAEQFGGVGDAVEEAADRFEGWVDDERPFGVTGADVQDLRERIAGTGVTDAAAATGVTPVAGLRLAGTIVTAIVLAAVSSFFLLRDGPKIRDAIVNRASPRSRARVGDVVDGAAGGLRGFLLGAALLGVVEGIAVGLTLWLTGAELALVMAAITFLGAFVPFVGAIVAGALAIGVALVTGGTGAAVVVAIVIVVVQQLDNDLLAPVIYGKLLQLHPLAVILATMVGIETAGLLGAFITVPLVAAVTGAWKGWSAGAPPEDATPDRSAPARRARRAVGPVRDG